MSQYRVEFGVFDRRKISRVPLRRTTSCSRMSFAPPQSETRGAGACSSRHDPLKTSVTGRCNVGFALHGFAPISHVPAERLDIPDRF